MVHRWTDCRCGSASSTAIGRMRLVSRREVHFFYLQYFAGVGVFSSHSSPPPMRPISKSRRPALQSVVCLAGAAAVLMGCVSAADEAKKKIVFIAGNPSHGPGEHEHRAGCQLLADHLNKSGLPVVATVTTNGWPKDNAIFDDAAAVIIYADGGGNHPAINELDELKKLAKKGIGLGAIHYAVEISNGVPGDTFLNLVGGYFETGYSVNPHWEASFKLPKHPITHGIEDYSMRDEWYYHMRFRKGMKGVTPILTDLPPPETLTRPDGSHSGNPEVRAAVLERKEAQHMMWAYDRPAEFGTGRSFGFTGGHFHKNWQNDHQRRIVLNAVVWIAGLTVPKEGVISATPTDDEMKAHLDSKG
jgi:type 1 glutamine amidotransferase